MAEEQKPTVEVPELPKQETTPALTDAVATETAPAAEDNPAEESAPADAAAEDKKDEVKPVEEGYLGHKAQGASFPKNLIPSKDEKSAETAHSNIAWASHTGKGLLFVGDKKAPTGLINLADASEPELDGSNKFHFTSKGNKHSFKAATPSERDGWVAQLKLKIAEAKELVATVTESEIYKTTVESFKPAPIVAKEDKPAEDATKTEESAKAEDAPQEGEAAKDESKEEPKTEEPKRRSASRKRASFFGFGKKEEKKEEPKTEEAAATEATEPAGETEAAKGEEIPAADVEAPAEPAGETEAATAESPKEKPVASKRNSFFGNVFSKKEKKPEAAKPADEATETPKEGEAAATDAAAPVIPPVESTTPLAVDVSSPATVPTETIETPATNGETKKDVKERRKSSLPFVFGKREKSPVPADGEEKSSKSAFSKLRATIKGRSASKAEDKSAESAATEAATEEPTKDVAATEEVSKEEAPIAEASKTAEPEAENKPENVASAAPVLTAAA
ncbi:hypothetical protein TOPH_04006 [Tolypocladium ophioglossoides CBS 100239]|uniref:Meiotic expression up-regulated protein 6 PH domain-containing protein n=1 Tax=Tolypocladium ophioglossoides (strain CBS 100239) TaxID=1163406 RepID=A0A0L0NB80_TOLOC|nr:hypothetical protein TOPH_04006 [Tolypocladium ophioglossoides CBS 100239]